LTGKSEAEDSLSRPIGFDEAERESEFRSDRKPLIFHAKQVPATRTIPFERKAPLG
jgi:hypothetical protein